MRGKLSPIVLALVIFFQQTSALYDKTGPVILLDGDNFKHEVLSTERLVLVEFFAPWCGHCKSLVPEYKRAAAGLKGFVKVAAIDCDDNDNRDLCAAYDVQGFPTIKMFSPNRIADKNNPGAYLKKPTLYTGARTAKAMVEYALSELPSYVQPISNKYRTKKSLTISEFLEKDNSTMPKVILFTSKERTTPLYKVLSADYRNRLLFGEVRQMDTEAVSEFGITTFPTLLVIPKGKTEPVKYNDKYNHESLFNFLSKYALPTKKSGGTDKKRSTTSAKSKPFNSEIEEIKTEDDLKKHCLSHSTGLCIFTFLPFEPEYAESVGEVMSVIKTLSQVNENLYNSLKNEVPLRFMWFNALTKESKRLIKDFKLADVFPVLMVYSPHKKVYTPYLGPFDVEGIEKFLKDVLKGKGNSFRVGFDVSLLQEPNEEVKRDSGNDEKEKSSKEETYKKQKTQKTTTGTKHEEL